MQACLIIIEADGMLKWNFRIPNYAPELACMKLCVLT